MDSPNSYNSSNSKLSFATPSSPSSYNSSSSSTPSLPTPTPVHEPGRHHTGFSPKPKKSRRSLFFSPKTKEKIDEIHHYQKEQVNLQREMFYEQRMNSNRLSLIESIALKFCGKSAKHDVFQPSSSHQPSSSGWNKWEQTPSQPQASPNSWERQNYWSPLQPYVENTKVEPQESSPKVPN